MGFLYARVCLPGPLFVGEASGPSGIVHGMMSGYYAAQSAGTAIHGTASRATAAEAYSEMLKNSDIVKTPFCYRHIEEFYGSYRTWLKKSKEITV